MGQVQAKQRRETQLSVQSRGSLQYGSDMGAGGDMESGGGMESGGAENHAVVTIADESAMERLSRAIEEYKTQTGLGCCFVESKLRTGVEIAVGSVLSVAFLCAAIYNRTQASDDNAAIGWAEPGVGVLSLGAMWFSFWRNTKYQRALNSHRHFGSMLDVVYSTLVQDMENLKQRVALNQQQAAQIRDLEGSVENITGELDRLKLVNSSLSKLSTSLTETITHGGAELQDLIDQAKQGQGKFFEKCLQLNKLSADLESVHERYDSTARQLDDLQHKMQEALDTVLRVPEMREFHESIEELRPQFKTFKGIAMRTTITDEEAKLLSGFIDTIEKELREVDEAYLQAEKDRSKNQRVLRLLRQGDRKSVV